ncbi:MAG: RIP metalloprotease RseP [bacterium]
MLISFLAFVFTLGVLIFVHELGHFLAAKRAGIRVEVFSLGFGPRLIGFRRGETDYRLSALPIGGYVKMAGQNDLNPTEAPTGAEWEFTSKSVGQRFLVVVAGPSMNVLLCLFILFATYVAGIKTVNYPPIVGDVVEKSPASEAGLRGGDRILTVDGREITDWIELNEYFHRRVGREVSLKIERRTDVLTKVIVPRLDRSTGMGSIGILPEIEPIVAGIIEGMPASQSNLRAGDRIIAIDGTPVRNWYEMSAIIRRNAGNPLEFTVERNGTAIKMTITPKLNRELGIGQIGISVPPPPMKIVRYSIPTAFAKSITKSIELVQEIYANLGRVITGRVSARAMGGPVMIASVAGAVARTGFTELLVFIAMISVNLGVINLMPLPILDGGHVILLALEKIMGHPVSERGRQIAWQIGVALLLLLMFFVTISDILRITGN